MIHTRTIKAALMIMAALAVAACQKDEFTPTSGPETQDEPQISKEIQLADQFASSVLDYCYFWNKEIASKLDKLSYKVCQDPIATVQSIRHSEDRWTQLFDHFSAFTEEVSGEASSTFGMRLLYGQLENTDRYFYVIAHTFEGSPSREAGLKRGDIILKVNGEYLTERNIETALDPREVTLTLGLLKDGTMTEFPKEVAMKATEMYLNPILSSRIIQRGGKRYGYLAYERFDLKSIPGLITACGQFKEAGVKDLILDLRYNTGGYVATEEVLASMLAPQENVSAGDVYQKAVYNDYIAQVYREAGVDEVSRFRTSHEISGQVYSTASSNIGLEHLYAIVTNESASASEALLIGLMPYMPVRLYGSRTYGKFCTGLFLDAPGWNKRYSALEDWGIYVMVGTYSDRDGNNPCRPDGIPVDKEISEDITDGCQIGDESETMLSAVLDEISGGTKAVMCTAQSRSRSICSRLSPLENPVPRRILLPK